MLMDEIEKPIFIIGAARSGTTLLYNILAGHPDLSWISNYTDYFRLPHLAVFSRFYNPFLLELFPRPINKIIPQPFEGQRILRNFIGYLLSIKPTSLEEKLSDNVIIHTKMTLAKHIKYQGGKRFLNKNIVFSNILDSINQIFPDGFFIHIIRDPRAVVASLLLVHWWPELKVPYKGEIRTIAELENKNINTLKIATELWVNSVNEIFNTREKMEGRYKEILYEELVRDPNKILNDILIHCELPYRVKFEKLLNNFRIGNKNFIYKTQLNKDDIKYVEGICQPEIRKIGVNYFD